MALSGTSESDGGLAGVSAVKTASGEFATTEVGNDAATRTSRTARRSNASEQPGMPTAAPVARPSAITRVVSPANQSKETTNFAPTIIARCRHDHPAERSDHRQRRYPQQRELAGDHLGLDLETHEEEEHGP
jgi:hypothetical protein